MFYISGFYKFKKINQIKKAKKLLIKIFDKYNIRGTIIISIEGINGTISSNKKNLKIVINKIKKSFNFKNFDSESLSTNKFQIFQIHEHDRKGDSGLVQEQIQQMMSILQFCCSHSIHFGFQMPVMTQVMS